MVYYIDLFEWDALQNVLTCAEAKLIYFDCDNEDTIKIKGKRSTYIFGKDLTRCSKIHGIYTYHNKNLVINKRTDFKIVIYR